MDLQIRDNLNRTDKTEVWNFMLNESSKIDKSHKLCNPGGFKKYFPELYNQIINDSNLDKYESFKQKMWHFFNNDYTIHYCPVCGKEQKFMSIIKGYRQFCSNECKYNDENYLKKVSDNLKEQWKENKNRQNTIQKLSEGRDKWWASLNKEERLLHIQPLHNAMRASIKNMSDDDRKKMYKKVSEKSQITRSNWSQEKKNEILRRQVSSYKKSLSSRSQEKKRQVSENIANGLKNMSPEQKKLRNEHLHQTKLKKTQDMHPEVIEIYTKKGNKNTIYTCKCQNPECNKCESKIFKTTFGSFIYRKKIKMELCPICHPNTIGTSSGEKDLLEYVKSIYSGIILANDRSVLDGKEIDIYLPDLKIGFEYQGDMWHANPILFDKSYVNPINHKTYDEIHKMDEEKKAYAESKGILLVYIWETDWIEHPRLTRRMIKDLINIL